MSKTQKIRKNIQFSAKVEEFLMENPSEMKKLPNNASIIVFTKYDTELNESNEKILKDLLDEGKTVIRAHETDKKKNMWRFTPATV